MNRKRRGRGEGSIYQRGDGRWVATVSNGFAGNGNPTREIRKPRVPRPKMQVWTKEEATTFLKASESDRLHALYVLALATGMRQGELFGLQWSDIDFAAGSVTVQMSLEEISGALRLKEPKSATLRCCY